MIMHPVTPPLQGITFWWRTEFQHLPSQCILQLLLCVSLLAHYETQNWAERSLFCFIRRNSTASNSRSHSHHKTELPDMIQAMAVLWENVFAVGQYFEGNYVRFNTYPVFYKLCKVHGSRWPSHVLFPTPLVTFSISETSHHSTKWNKVLLHNTNFSCLMFCVSFAYVTSGYILQLLQSMLKHFITACFEVCINALK